MRISALSTYRPQSIVYILAAALCTLASIIVIIAPSTVSAAACTPPGTDYGTVTHTVNITSAGSYRIWTRMAAPSSSANTYLLEVDNNTCFTVGGSSVPVYTGGTSTHFVNNTTNWIGKTSGGTFIDVTLTAGNHSFELIGNATGVVVDRVLLTKDNTCIPTGTGNNCASIYLAPDIDQNGTVNFLDFSRLASKYNQTGGSIGRCDINLDGVVDFLDFSSLASKYGQ